MANIEAFTLLALALVIMIIRVWARWNQVGPSNWQLDDYLMPLTGVSYIYVEAQKHGVGCFFTTFVDKLIILRRSLGCFYARNRGGISRRSSLQRPYELLHDR